MTEDSAAQRYVAGRMDATEKAKFEALMIEQQAVAADVDVRQRIKAGLKLLEERAELEAIVQKPVPRWDYRWAAAAAVLLVIFGATLMLRQPGPATPGGNIAALIASNGPGGNLVASATYLLAKTRSDPTPLTVPVSPKDEIIKLQIIADGDLTAPITATLASVADNGISTLGKTEVWPGADGYIEVFVRGGALSPGLHELRLSAPGSEPETFRFIVSR
jgi:hypothetical protein